ncbi:Rickettsia surface antigen [uncultured delta proteobacterium]|uniref:Rickettsia surface antigen n=1 Tax=uncultured delta proteobacterium TaxID=34034 RepID=A0A212JUX0_9DELT|nr:Rickettsia surface antigen [uncultured delta proteobacterium]
MKKMMIRKSAVPVFILAALLALGGCATTGGKSYSKEEARQVQTVQRGVIVSISEVSIEQDASIVGTGIGGVLGGVVGSTMGGGKGRILTTAGGAAIGAVLGALGEKAVRTEKAYEFMIDLENNGGTISIVQAIDGDYAVGDRVRILRSSGNRARVVKAN